jgi:hypothetical protein
LTVFFSPQQGLWSYVMNAQTNAAIAAAPPDEGCPPEPTRPGQEAPAPGEFSATDVVLYFADAARGVKIEAITIYMLGRLFPAGMDISQRNLAIRDELKRQHPQLADLNVFGLVTIAANGPAEAQAAQCLWAEREAARLGLPERLKITSLSGATRRWVNNGGKCCFYTMTKDGGMTPLLPKQSPQGLVLV